MRLVGGSGELLHDDDKATCILNFKAWASRMTCY